MSNRLFLWAAQQLEVSPDNIADVQFQVDPMTCGHAANGYDQPLEGPLALPEGQQPSYAAVVTLDSGQVQFIVVEVAALIAWFANVRPAAVK